MDESAAVPEPGPTPRPLGDTVLQSQTLESVASAQHYHAWLTDLALPHLGEHPLELGSGLGDYAHRWLSLGVPEITVTEIDPGRLEVLRNRFGGDPRVHVRSLDVLGAPPADHSAFLAFNVLEHIPEDVTALRGARRLVRPGGAVVVLVPAFPALMSPFDRAVGHVRRYTRASLRTALTSAGLVVDDLRYLNAPGLAAWFVGMRLLHMTPGDGPVLQVWDRAVVPVARFVEQRRSAPFGQSVFAVAHRPGA